MASPWSSGVYDSWGTSRYGSPAAIANESGTNPTPAFPEATICWACLADSTKTKRAFNTSHRPAAVSASFAALP